VPLKNIVADINMDMYLPLFPLKSLAVMGLEESTLGADIRAVAAKAMSAAGYSTCLNVADGFEGPLDTQAKRGSAGGWKAAGLPWRQT
jgi:hypothetical protein